MCSATVGIPSDPSSLVARLNLEQKVRLLTGENAWVLYGEPAIGLRPIVMSDGPAGVRGTHFDASNPSSSLPCGVALAATWDESLIEQLATALGREARARGVDILLAPTVNIVRTPLSGRGFECFSEDPVLTARIAVGYVRGLQNAGVGATVKHFIANDSETERHTYDARIAEQVLRELYLPPFEACIAEAGAYLVMAAYNSVNGATMTANGPLLIDLLKNEWAFGGVVVSDWHAATSTVRSAAGGLDLVMPGPDGPWGERLLAAVRSGDVPESVIDEKVSRLLVLARRLGALSDTSDGDGAQSPPAPHAAPIDPDFLAHVASRSFVLLKNRDGLLPLWTGTVERLALIGPNAAAPQTQGGGSVRVLSAKRPAIADSLRDVFDAYVTMHQGCATGANTAAPAEGSIRDPVSGKLGVRLEVRTGDGQVVHDAPFHSSTVTWWDGLPDAVHLPGSELVMRTLYQPATDGAHNIGAAAVGRLRISIDGSVIGEATSVSPKESVEALSRPPEVRVPVELRAGREVEVRVEYRPELRFAALRLGIAPQLEEERLLDEAVQAAAAADVAVVVVGSAEGTESEGYDRDTLALPGRQDELVRRVAAANPKTVVVVNSGMPMLMPWADDVAAILQVWFPGQAFGEALAAVLAGIAEPGGRLPVSFPKAEADSPVLHARPDAGRLDYAEGFLVGYRGFDRRGLDPLFCFGHGLGYTEWAYMSIQPAATTIAAGDNLEVGVAIRNAGPWLGHEVVQLYLEGPDDGDAQRPLRVLASFAGVDAEAGAQVQVRMTVPARAFMRFDDASHAWVAHPGAYMLHAGRSSRDLRLKAQVVLQ